MQGNVVGRGSACGSVCRDNSMTTVKSDHLFEVPRTIAVCQYCGGKILAQCDSWAQGDDGQWLADHCSVDCETEPGEISGDEWRDWWANHSDMPYVYWLPVEIEVTE